MNTGHPGGVGVAARQAGSRTEIEPIRTGKSVGRIVAGRHRGIG